MLRALYEYAERMQLTLPAGYADKTVKAFLHLTSSGKFTGLFLSGSETFRCPDIGSLANGTDKSNVLVEKRSVVFPEAPTLKNAFFRKTLEDLGQTEPLAALCLNALNDPAVYQAMLEALDQHKIKNIDRVSFLIDSTYLVECDSVRLWWNTYRLQFQKPATSAVPCLITGVLTTPMATVPKSKGLSTVGGHSSGDALICFDKSAFCSYGLKQSANAPVSEEAYAQIKAALDDLLKDAPTLAGCKFVHWYDKPLPPSEEDLALSIIGPVFEDDDPEDAPTPQQMRRSRQNATELVNSVRSGAAAHELPNLYYIALLSGVNGRVMVRRFSSGSYAELKANLDRWNDELRLTNSAGTGNLPSIQLIARMIRLLKRQKADKNVFERLFKELSGLSNAIVMSIINGGPLPDAVAVRSLNYIRSQMLEDTESTTPNTPDHIACQWLKAWLMRNHKEESIMPTYQAQNPSTAYHCGALVAVYAAIQQRAYPEVNVSVVQRFFASAMQTPALALGQLAKASVHHLAKLEKPIARSFEKKLAAISSSIPGQIPATLTVPEQAQFALGYYQMSAEMNHERLERMAAKQQEV